MAHLHLFLYIVTLQSYTFLPSVLDLQKSLRVKRVILRLEPLFHSRNCIFNVFKMASIYGFLRVWTDRSLMELNLLNMVDGEEFHSHTDQLSQLLVVLDEQERYHAKAGLGFEASPVFSLLIQISVL